MSALFRLPSLRIKLEVKPVPAPTIAPDTMLAPSVEVVTAAPILAATGARAPAVATAATTAIINLGFVIVFHNFFQKKPLGSLYLNGLFKLYAYLF